MHGARDTPGCPNAAANAEHAVGFWQKMLSLKTHTQQPTLPCARRRLTMPGTLCLPQYLRWASPGKLNSGALLQPSS